MSAESACISITRKVQAANLIGQYDAGDNVAGWNGDLKRVTSCPVGNWAQTQRPARSL